MLGIPTTTSATIQQAIRPTRNHYLRRATGRIRGACAANLTVNVGLRFEWEDGITEDGNAMIVGLRSDGEAGDFGSGGSGVRQGAHPAAGGRGASRCAADRSVRHRAGQDGASWRPEAMWMPRVSAAYKLGEQDRAEGRLRRLLRHAERHRLHREQRWATARRRPTPTARTSARRSRWATRTPASWGSPIRSRCARMARASTRRSARRLGVDTSRGAALHVQNQNHVHARQQRWRIGRPARAAQEPLGGSGLRRVVLGSHRRSASGRTTCPSSTGFRAA